MGFSRQGYQSGFPCPPPGDLPHPGIKLIPPVAPALLADSSLLSHLRKPQETCMSRNTFYKYLLSQIFDKHWTRGNSWTEFSYVQWQGDIYFLLDGTVLKNQCRRRGFDPWVGKMPWSGKWQPTPVFLPGKFHGQRSLAGHSPGGHKISNTTEQMRQKHENTPSTINRILFLFFSEGTPPRPKDREDKRESHFCLFKLRKVFARVYFVSKRSNQQIHLSGHQEAVLHHQVRTIALCVLLMLFQNPVLLQSCWISCILIKDNTFFLIDSLSQKLFKDFPFKVIHSLMTGISTP